MRLSCTEIGHALQGNMRPQKASGLLLCRRWAREYAYPGSIWTPLRGLSISYLVERGKEAERFLRERKQRFAPPIVDTLIRQLRAELAAGVRAGERISDLRARVRRVLVDQAPDRISKIARTEVVGALNAGANAAYNRSPVVGQKKWLTARDDRVRVGTFDHREADGQVVDKDQPFTVSGESLMFPGDPNGSPGNIIRCRCTIRPVISRSP